MLKSLKQTYNNFPSLFWLVVFTLFIDSIGSTLLFPFFALYITEKFGVGMTQAGILIGMSSLFGIIGSMIGGALTDRFGRRKLILFGLVFSALSSLSFGLASDVNLLYLLVILVGILSRLAAPAQDAMMADILPESKRQEGFGITRVVFNLAWIFGAALGGLIASKSFLALFVTDAVISSLVAVILYFKLPETMPEHHKEEKARESFLQTVSGYRVVLQDFAYTAFILAGILSLLVYQQEYSSFPVYLRDIHNINSEAYGIMLAIAGLEVVLFQFWVSRIIRKYHPFWMMVIGTLFFMVGFTMIGFIRGIPMFLLAVILITVGEMIVFPTNRVIAVTFAPADMRGRYMAIYDLGWTLPATFGPAAAGLILDHYNPNLLWYVGGFMCAVSALGYYALHLKMGAQARFAPATDD
ncbi:MAG: Multidrug resistance protein MdtH [Anaerolineales bacterium]|nr:Multidrug resistance protein MdtH [Anaerolineales bacterium]